MHICSRMRSQAHLCISALECTYRPTYAYLLSCAQNREKELALRQAKQAQIALQEATDMLPNLRFQVCLGVCVSVSVCMCVYL